AIRTGTIETADLAAALAAAPADWRLPTEAAELLKLADNDRIARKPPAVVATVAEVLNELAAGDRHVARTAFMTDEISRWCAAYFDEGQSVWRMPARGLRPYAAWRAWVRYDRNPEMMGIARFRALVADMPDDYVAAIATVIERLGIPARAVEDYLHQALLEIGGWAAYARYLMWNHELAGDRDDTLEQLLAIRVVWGYTLFAQRTDTAFREAWRRAMEQAALPPLDDQLGGDPDFCINMVLQEAYEIAFRRRLLDRLAGAPAARTAGARPAVQAAFCIDVRSEVYRRAMESVGDGVETVGFAGFFGFPIEFVPIGHVTGRAHCPVLLRPQFTVCEAVGGTSEEEDSEILVMRLLRRRVRKAWKSFKLSAVSSFIYVETAGLLFAGKILSDSLAVTRTVHDPNTDGLDDDLIGRLGPRIEPRPVGGRATGFDPAQRVAMAEAVLRAMSMTGPFARLVMLTGHGSTTVNNPHASGLDCGACGGHTGEANARVAAAILNDPDVRVALRQRGIDIPDDTVFLGCLHDTTTDVIRLFDIEQLPASQADDLRRLRALLAKATSLTRLERAALLGIARGAATEQQVVTRSRDWAQVRPEWGLAGNASFIAAPRARTRGIDLGGRSFLHDYDWQQDKDFGTLQLIMTAPMVVASWINLQYYGSTVNNAAFGAGNKVLHNVVGTLGVLEGNAGDLKVGLPWQSVHDGSRFVHEPLRLTVLIEAPLEAINGVIAKNDIVRELVDHHWLHLYAISPQGRVSHAYRGHLLWQQLEERSEP
ncbi:YbcC family protein, partial [Bradyrhizobium sp.]|uniref:YbcC family protein n=1 Tax=Bradyrhizobium sp. TaxID=376 RepID=UPI003919E002